LARLTALLGLRVTLAVRRFTTRTLAGRVVLAVLALLLGAGATASGLSLVSLARSLGEGRADGLLHGTFVALYLWHLLESGVSATVREGGASERLALYPVPGWMVSAADLLVGLGSPAALLSLWVLVLLALGAPGSPGSALPRLAVALAFVVHLAALRSCLHLAAGRVLRVRALREAALVVAPLLGLALLLPASRVVAGLRDNEGLLVSWQPPAALHLLPGMWFGTAFAPTVGSNPLLQVAEVLGAATGTAVLVAAAMLLQDATHPLHADGSGRRSRPGPAPLRRRPVWERLPQTWVPAEVAAVAVKELRCLWRNPFLLFSMAAQVIAFFLPQALWYADASALAGPTAGLPAGLLAVLLLVELTPTFNQLGLDGPGIESVLQSPAPRARVLVGKNLAYAAAFGPLNAGAVALACAATGTPPGLYLVAAAVSLPVLLAVGNVVSVLVPVPLWTSGRAGAGRGLPRAGCGTTLLRLAFFQCVPFLVLPPVLALWLAQRFLPPGAAAWLVPACLAWGGLVYALATAFALHRFESREDRIALALVASGE